MTVSSDGILVFGFPIGEEGEDPEFLDGYDDIDHCISSKFGLPEWPERDWDAYRKTVDGCPADLTLYCSFDYPMHILAVRGTEVNVSRGDAKEIKPKSLAIAPERIAAFKTWCEENGIEYQEPKWLLCSLYG